MTSTPTSAPSPLILLVGPPGSGKTTLGGRACLELGLRFLDLGTVPTPLAEVAEHRSADVVEVPWSLQQDPAGRKQARLAGTPLLLWDHPAKMQARSGHPEPLFTPVGRLKSGFGRNGTGCREFRVLSRAFEEQLLLIGLSPDEAFEAVRDSIKVLRAPSTASLLGQAGLSGSANYWVKCGASQKAADLLAETMARYLMHLRAQGVAQRRLSGVLTDLDVAGWLVFSYEAPNAANVLDCFDGPPNTYEFSHKVTDAPNAVRRYCASLTGFSRFLAAQGLIAEE